MGIRWGVLIYVFLVALVPLDVGASVTVIDSDVIDSVWNIKNDTIIYDDVTVNVDDINIIRSIRMKNSGIINGAVNICPGCDVYIENAGLINATFYAPDGASVVQMVYDNSDLRPIGVDGKYEILLSGAEGVSMSGLRNMVIGADRVVISDSELLLDSIYARAFGIMPDVELRGTVTLVVDDVTDISNGPVLSNVHGDGTIVVYSDKISPLYRFESMVKDDALYVNVVRDTNYTKILDNKLGEFLDSLRVQNPNDKLLAKMDAATNFDEINSIVNMSGRLTPIRLMDSVRMFNMFELNKFANNNDNIYVAPEFVSMGDFYTYSISAGGMGIISENLFVGVNAYVGYTDFSNDYDEYKIALYGGNVHIDYFYNNLFVRTIAGATVAAFNTDMVFDGTNVVEQPNGVSAYGGVDAGIVLNYGDDFSVSPFVRLAFDYANILGFTDTRAIAAIGTDIILATGGYDVKYDYGFRASVDTCGQIYAAVRANILSVADNAGGTFSVGAVYDDTFGAGYKIQIGANLVF